MIWLEEGLSRFEQARLGSLLLAISAHQEAVQQKRVASMTQLVGNRGERGKWQLVGIAVLEGEGGR